MNKLCHWTKAKRYLYGTAHAHNFTVTQILKREGVYVEYSKGKEAPSAQVLHMLTINSFITACYNFYIYKRLDLSNIEQVNMRLAFSLFS